MAFISLATGKKHLRTDNDDEDADIQLKIDGACAAVLSYMRLTDDAYVDEGASPTGIPGDPIEPPKNVVAAALLMLGYLYIDRDNDEKGAYAQGFLPKPVTALLYPLRDPAVA